MISEASAAMMRDRFDRQIEREPPALEQIEQSVPISGWRVFGLADTAGGPMLQGLRRVFWETAELKAYCDNAPLFFWSPPIPSLRARRLCLLHLAQKEPCPVFPFGSGFFVCGIYGRTNLDHHFGALFDFDMSRRVLCSARCVAYGIVAMDKRGGWRASDVIIEELFIHPPTVEGGVIRQMEDRYQVPVKVCHVSEMAALSRGKT